MDVNAATFRTLLGRKLSSAAKQGEKFLQINAGALQRETGGYPGPSHRMPIRCPVMRSEMTIGDRIVAALPKGNGASLTIRYRLPRRSN